MKPFQKILAATDFGESSTLALDIAADLAQRYGAELVIVHAVEETKLMPATMLGEGSHGGAAAQNGLNAAVEQAQVTVPGTRGVLLKGHPADQIQTFVEENGIDLLVVGTHGRKRAARLVLGSVAEKLVRACRIPVLTIYDTQDRAISRLAP